MKANELLCLPSHECESSGVTVMVVAKLKLYNALHKSVIVTLFKSQ